MASENDKRKVFVGLALGLFTLIVLSSLWLALSSWNAKPALPQHQIEDGYELDDLNRGRKHSRNRDLERGVVRDAECLPSPLIFTIHEMGEGGKSNPTRDCVPPIREMQAMKPHRGPSHVGLEFAHAKTNATTGYHGNTRPRAHEQRPRHVRRGAVEPVMGKSILLHDQNDAALLMPSGASLPRKNSEGKCKAREGNEESCLGPFGLSLLLSPPGPSRSSNSDAAWAGSDVFLTVPKPVMTKRSRNRHVSRLSVIAGSPAIPGPSRALGMPHPSTFEVLDTDVSDEGTTTPRWKPAAPKVSRYRGLSATRPDQKPRTPSPPRPLFPDDYNAPGPAGVPPLPAPETFEVNDRLDSWGYFPPAREEESSDSTGPKHSSDADSGDYNSDEWTSMICSTVMGPRPDDTLQTCITEADDTKSDAGKDASVSMEHYPDWEIGGPIVPDSRILTLKASLPGRKTRFVEVEVDGPAETAGSPVETTVFKDCLELLREGARTPPLLTDTVYVKEERPGLARGSTWGMSGDLFKRRRDRDRGEGGVVGEDSSKPKFGRQMTSFV